MTIVGTNITRFPISAGFSVPVIRHRISDASLPNLAPLAEIVKFGGNYECLLKLAREIQCFDDFLGVFGNFIGVFLPLNRRGARLG